MKVMYAVMKYAYVNDIEFTSFTATPEELAALVTRECTNYTFDIEATVMDTVLDTIWFTVVMHRVPVQVIG